MDNMALWNKVCTTDPKFTKAVNLGFKFTDIDSMWNIKRATELWGPYGSTWGIQQGQYGLVNDSKQTVVGIIFSGTFKYPGGEFYIAVDLPYEPRGSTLKKLQTMAIGKALSRLGFSADVYEGKFDDSAYVQTMEQQYSGSKETKPEQKKPKKTVKYPEPDPNASGILGQLAQEYMDLVAGNDKYQGMVVSFMKVCRAVYDEFGQYPTKVESIPLLLDKVPIDRVLEKNDFLDGIE